jgi:hypothetical protein
MPLAMRGSEPAYDALWKVDPARLPTSSDDGTGGPGTALYTVVPGTWDG